MEVDSGLDRWLDVPFDVENLGTNSRLFGWIENNPEIGEDVLETLLEISDIFADTSTLETKYGLVLAQRDNVRSFSSPRFL